MAPPAEQQLSTFAKPPRTLLVKRLQALPTSPCPSGVTKLAGLYHYYRIREGGCRIIYAIRENNLVVLAIKNSTRTHVFRA